MSDRVDRLPIGDSCPPATPWSRRCGARYEASRDERRVSEPACERDTKHVRSCARQSAIPILSRRLTCPPEIDPACIFGFCFGSSEEQIIGKLRTAEIELAKGLGTAEVVRKLGIAEQTYYRWRKEYGGLRLDQAKRLKELEKENTRLKKLVADQALDNAILKEVSSGKF